MRLLVQAGSGDDSGTHHEADTRGLAHFPKDALGETIGDVGSDGQPHQSISTSLRGVRHELCVALPISNRRVRSVYSETLAR